MKKLKTLLCILLSFVMMLGFAACGRKDSAAAEETAPAQPQEPQGDENEEVFEIVIPEVNPDLGLEGDSLALINDVQQVLDRPHQIQPGTTFTAFTHQIGGYTPWNATAETWLLTNIYEGLVYRYMGRPDDIRPLIAESWSHTDDYLMWTYIIRKGIKFTDGTVCDAAAIAESWNYFFEVSPATFYNLNIESWEAAGEYELTVRLTSPLGWFESCVSELYIVSPAALAEFGVNDDRAAVGTAPYYLSEYGQTGNCIFKANPDYYLYERMPVIETVELKTAYDDKAKIKALLSGDADCYHTTLIKYCKELLADNFDGTLLQGYSSANPLFFYAKNEPSFEHFEVRKAMSRFIDMNWVNEDLYEGEGLVQSSIWTVGTCSEVPWPEGYYYSPDEGLALLAEAGIEPASITLSPTIIESSEDIFLNLKGQLESVGVTLEYEFLPVHASFISPVYEGPLLFGNCGYKNIKPNVPWSFILTPDALVKQIMADVYDPELYQTMCDTYNAINSAATWEELVMHSKNLTDMVQRDYCAMPGVQAPYYAFFQKDLKGIVVVTEAHVLLWNYLYL